MRKTSAAFTIVELLIVVVVIAILAAITIVSYNGIVGRAREATLKSDLHNGASQLQLTNSMDGAFPGNANDLKKSDGTEFQYTNTADTFCLTATNRSLAGKSFYVTEGGSIQSGVCPGHSSTGPIANGDIIQTVTNANCPSSRTMVADGRDNRSYWIQKLGDGKCWMLTSLAYAGGGTNTYGDVKTLQNGTSDTLSTFTAAKYYIPSGANPTSKPTLPSTSTTGTGQYGYHYNWCAAMGVQTSTSACNNTTTPLPNTTISICPAGWRLPTGGTSTGEFTALNNAVNSGSTSTDFGLRNVWLAQRSGFWNNGGYTYLGSDGYFWASGQYSATGADHLYLMSNYAGPEFASNKGYGMTIRCVAV